MEKHLPGWELSDRVPDELSVVPVSPHQGGFSPRIGNGRRRALGARLSTGVVQAPSQLTGVNVYPSLPIAFQYQERPPACGSGLSLSDVLVTVFGFLDVEEILQTSVVSTRWHNSKCDIRYTHFRAVNDYVGLFRWEGRLGLANLRLKGHLSKLKRLELAWCGFSLDEVFSIIGFYGDLEHFTRCHCLHSRAWAGDQSLNYPSGRPTALLSDTYSKWTGDWRMNDFRPRDEAIAFICGGDDSLAELRRKLCRSHPAIDMRTTDMFCLGRCLYAVVHNCNNLLELRWRLDNLEYPWVVGDTMIAVHDAICKLPNSCPNVQVLELSRSFDAGYIAHYNNAIIHLDAEEILHTLAVEMQESILDDSLLSAISRLTALKDLTLCIEGNQFSAQGIASLCSSRSLVHLSLAHVKANISKELSLAPTLRRLCLDVVDDGANQPWSVQEWATMCEKLTALEELWVYAINPHGAVIVTPSKSYLSHVFPGIMIFHDCLNVP